MLNILNQDRDFLVLVEDVENIYITSVMRKETCECYDKMTGTQFNAVGRECYIGENIMYEDCILGSYDSYSRAYKVLENIVRYDKTKIFVMPGFHLQTEV